MARPRKRLPPGSRDMLMAMASDGCLSESKAADACGLTLRAWRRLLKENEDARQVWDEALSIERDALLAALYNRAVEGDTNAARTLLATRHGMSERQPQGDSGRVHVTFNLPPALDPEQYMKAISVTQGALPDGRSD